MKHPASRVATVGLAAAAVLSTALFVVSPAEAQPVAGSGTAAGNAATASYRAKGGVSAGVSASSIPFDWGYRNGWWVLNLNGLPVSAGQAVAVSATEADAAGNEFIGAAHIHCENVAVTQNRVSVRCLFDWGSPIHVRLHYVY